MRSCCRRRLCPPIASNPIGGRSPLLHRSPDQNPFFCRRRLCPPIIGTCADRSYPFGGRSHLLQRIKCWPHHSVDDHPAARRVRDNYNSFHALNALAKFREGEAEGRAVNARTDAEAARQHEATARALADTNSAFARRAVEKTDCTHHCMPVKLFRLGER